jgi:hypothetical protein
MVFGNAADDRVVFVIQLQVENISSRAGDMVEDSFLPPNHPTTIATREREAALLQQVEQADSERIRRSQTASASSLSSDW